MCNEEYVEISKADDGGYIIKVRVKVKKDKDSKSEVMCDSRSEHKTLVAQDIKEVKEIMDKVLPDMTPGGMLEDEFKEAFKEAIKEDN